MHLGCFLPRSLHAWREILDHLASPSTRAHASNSPTLKASMPPRPRPPPGPPRPPWPTPPPSPANEDTIAALPHASRFRCPLHMSTKSLIELFLDPFGELSNLLRICEWHVASADTSNICDASISHQALLDHDWNGDLEGIEEI